MHRYSRAVSDAEGVPEKGKAKPVLSLTSAAAMKTHLTLVVGLGLCAGAFIVELGRAQSGNSLSWAYVFEWPLLALFAIYMWWKLLHPGFTMRRRREHKPIAPEYEGMLRAWQGEVIKLESDRRGNGAENPPLSRDDPVQ